MSLPLLLMASVSMEIVEEKEWVMGFGCWREVACGGWW